MNDHPGVLPITKLLPGEAQRYKRLSRLVGHLQLIILVTPTACFFLLMKKRILGDDRLALSILVGVLVALVSVLFYEGIILKRLHTFQRKSRLLGARWLSQLSCGHWIHIDITDFYEYNNADMIPELTVSALVTCPTCGETRMLENFKVNNPDNWDW